MMSGKGNQEVPCLYSRLETASEHGKEPRHRDMRVNHFSMATDNDIMQNQTHAFADLRRHYLCAVFLSAVILIAIISQLGCANSTNQTTRNFPAIKHYIKDSMGLFHDLKLYELRMEAEPSPEGGEIVVSGDIYDQTTYNLMVQFLSNPALGPVPAKLVWKVKIDPIRAPNHHIY